MNVNQVQYRCVRAVLLTLALAACGGGGSGGGSGTGGDGGGTGGGNGGGSGGGNGGGTSGGTCTATHTVAGSVSALSGTGLVLTLNGGSDLPVGSNGAFTFPALCDGSAFEVAVKGQPSGPTQTCAVTRGKGTLSGADVTDVAVTCSHFTKQLGAAGASTAAHALAISPGGDLLVAGTTSGGLDGVAMVGSGSTTSSRPTPAPETAGSPSSWRPRSAPTTSGARPRTPTGTSS